MVTTTSTSSPAGAKGKERAANSELESEESSSAGTTSDSESDSSSDSGEEITEDYLRLLLQRARESAAAAESAESQIPEGGPQEDDEDVLVLDNADQPLLPKLNPGNIPPSYLQIGETRGEAGLLVRDPEAEEAEKKASSSLTIISPPLPPPELTKAGKPLTKREKKDLKKQTAGPDWFDMPAPPEADLPRLHREIEALRLRNQLDPKRFYRKDEGEGKGIKGLPKYMAVGQVVATESPFRGSSTDNLPKSQRKRTLLDELIDDAEAKRYAKKKFTELQVVRGARGKNTLREKQALRKPKW